MTLRMKRSREDEARGVGLFFRVPAEVKNMLVTLAERRGVSATALLVDMIRKAFLEEVING